MSKIHYFQRYSQKENVVTNNTMLLFSRLYSNYPFRFECVVGSLLNRGGVCYDVGLAITVQQGNLSRLIQQRGN